MPGRATCHGGLSLLVSKKTGKDALNAG